jgi:hypothetical protein
LPIEQQLPHQNNFKTVQVRSEIRERVSTTEKGTGIGQLRQPHSEPTTFFYVQ